MMHAMERSAVNVYRSPSPDIEIPLVTVHGLIDGVVAITPDLVACIDALTGRTISYSDLGSEVDRVAGAFVARGLAKGERVAIMAPNSIEWLVVALGVMKSGGVVTGANPGCTVDELTHQLVDAEAVSVVTTTGLLDIVTTAIRSSATMRELIVLDATAETVWPSASDSMARAGFADLLRHDSPSSAVAVGLDDLCALPFSSGTTGRSKGVQLTHRTVVANICQVASLAPIEPADRVLAFLPFFHIMGFAVVALGGLATSATLVTLPGFEPHSFLSAIADHSVRTVFVVPPVANFLAATPLADDYDLSSLQTIGCGAAPLGGAVEEILTQRFGCQVRQGYGMTESSGCISYPRFADEPRPGASGALLPNTEGAVVDPETGESLPAGETGEVWFRGPQVFTGYLHNPEASSATIIDDGWVRTGDIGYFDADGFLYITDRLKELIKVKGFQVAPAELEALLFTHPGVADVAVIGRPDDRAGEVPVAYVVPTDAVTDPADIANWMNGEVSDYKRLGEVIMTDAIPKNPSGKILRRILRDADQARFEPNASARDAGRSAPAENPGECS